MPGKKRLFSEDEPTRETSRRRVEESVHDESTDKQESHLLRCPAKGNPALPVDMQYPARLLSFSYNGERKLLFDDSAMKYFVNPPPNADLRYGYTRWIKRPEEKGRLDGLLRAVTRYRQGLNANASPVSQADEPPGDMWLKQMSFVSWRGVMTKILTAPYEERDGWKLNIMRLNDTIYLEEHLSDAKLAEKEDMTPHHRLQSYYGYSFESFCTSTHPHKQEALHGHPPGWSGDINTNVQWCSVVKTKLATHRLLIGGEVDCVRANRHSESASSSRKEEFVELKTSMTIRSPQDEARFEKKLLKFYFQSFLLGVPEIVVGFRTPPGRLIQTQSFRTMELPRLVRGKPHAWDPHLCMNWGDSFLGHLKKYVPNQQVQDKKHVVWQVNFTPGTGIELTELDETGVAEVENNEERVGFLPKWYFDDLQELKASSLS